MNFLSSFLYVVLMLPIFSVSAVHEQFDPRTYSCEQFVEDIENQSDMAAIAVVWANGYIAGILGVEKAQVLDNKHLEKDVASIKQICINSEQKPETFLAALQIALKK